MPRCDAAPAAGARWLISAGPPLDTGLKVRDRGLKCTFIPRWGHSCRLRALALHWFRVAAVMVILLPERGDCPRIVSGALISVR